LHYDIKRDREKESVIDGVNGGCFFPSISKWGMGEEGKVGGDL